jgi:hypothetical protein
VRVVPDTLVTVTTSSEAVSASRIAVHGVWAGNPDKAATVIEVVELLAEADNVVATAVDE